MKSTRILAVLLSIVLLFSLLPHAFALEDLAALQAQLAQQQAEYQQQLQAAQAAAQQDLAQAQQAAEQQVQQAQKAYKQATCKHEWTRVVEEDRDPDDGVHDEVTVCRECEKELDRVTVEDKKDEEQTVTLRSALKAAPTRGGEDITTVEQLQAALDAGGTVTLTQSIALDQDIDIVKDVTLCLEDGVVLSSGGTAGALSVPSGVKLTITGSGTVHAVIVNGGSATISSGTVGLLAVTGGSATVSSGTIDIVDISYGGSATISGGAVNSLEVGNHSEICSATINGGTVGEVHIYYLSKVTIYGEEVICNDLGGTLLYGVTCAPATHGTVTADKQIAAEGATVTLTVSSDGGYELDDLMVTYTDGQSQTQNIALTQPDATNKPNEYTFEMPAAPVIVTAMFKEEGTITKADALKAELDNASTDQNNPTEIKLGRDISGTFTVKSGTYVSLNLNRYNLTGSENAIEVAGNFDVYDGISSGTITNVLVSGGSFGLSDGSATDVTVSGGSFSLSGGSATDVTVSGGSFSQSGGSAAEVTVSGGSFSLSNGSATDVTVSGGSFSLSGGTVNKAGNLYAVTVNSGIFNLSGGPKITGGLYLAADKVINIVGKLTDGGIIDTVEMENHGVFTKSYSLFHHDDPSHYFCTANGSNPCSWDDSGKEAQLTTRTVTCKAVPIAGGTVTASTETIAAAASIIVTQGEYVTLTVTPNTADGYELDTLTVKDVNGNAITVTNNQFSMPSDSATVTATFKQTSSGTPYSLISDIPPVSDGGIFWYGGYQWKIIGQSGNSYLVISADKIVDKAADVITGLNVCSTVYDGFAEREKNLVIPTNKTDSDFTYHSNSSGVTFNFGAVDLKNATLFMLSAEEILTYTACYPPDCWMLRSYEPRIAGIDGKGFPSAGPFIEGAVNGLGVRPVFVLDMSSVLFESAATGGKTEKPENGSSYGAFRAAAGDNRKMTFLDSSRGKAIASPNTTTVIPGGNITVAYSNITDGDNVSAFLYEGDTVRYYATHTPDGTGKWTMKLPSVLTVGGTYTLKIFSEQQNGETHADFAGAMSDPITLSVAPNTWKALQYDVGNSADALDLGYDAEYDGVSGPVEITKENYILNMNGHTVDGGSGELAVETVFDISGRNIALNNCIIEGGTAGITAKSGSSVVLNAVTITGSGTGVRIETGGSFSVANSSVGSVWLGSGSVIGLLGTPDGITADIPPVISVTTEAKPATGKPLAFTNGFSTAYGSVAPKDIFTSSEGYDVILLDGEAALALPTYTITWQMDDGSVIDITTVEYGKVPTHAEPVKAATAGKTYAFSGWTPDIVAATGDATYKAVFSDTANSYKITWQMDDGSVIDTTTVEYGKVPTHADPTKQATAGKTYVFSGWEPNVVAATGDATYKAVFSDTTNSYTITWQMDDGSVIDTTTVEYGKVPTHAAPTKAATAEYTYTFAGWLPDVTAVTGNATYQAVFTPVPKELYVVVWLNGDGAELDRKTYKEGEAEPKTDKVPAKAADAGFTYTFDKWDAGTKDGNLTVYKPQFIATAIQPQPPEVLYRFIQTTDSWQQNITQGAVYRVERTAGDGQIMSLFLGVQVDGKTVPQNGYEKQQGSVIITLKPAYLLTLDTGWHTLTVFFTDGSVSTPFMIVPSGGAYYSTSTSERYTYVPPSNNPRTGDESNLTLWGSLAAASLAGTVLTMRKRKHSH